MRSPKWVLVSVLAAALGIYVMSVSATHAWDCSLPENSGVAECPVHTPTPVVKKHHKKTPIPTSVLTPPTTTPTSITTPTTLVAVPSTSSSTSPVITSQPASQSSSPLQHQDGQVCVWEPTTMQWEIRRHFGDQLEANQRWPMERDLCEQDREPTPTPVTPPATLVVERAPTVEATPVPTYVVPDQPRELQTSSYACVNSDLLVPILDEHGDHMLHDGYPMWLIAGDESGQVMIGEACPITPEIAPEVVEAPAPHVPVQLP